MVRAEREYGTGYVVGREGRPASFWYDDLGAMCAAFRHLVPGLYWIQHVVLERASALEDMRSTGEGDWGFIHVRKGGGWLLGTPGVATAVEEMAALVETGGRP